MSFRVIGRVFGVLVTAPIQHGVCERQQRGGFCNRFL